MYIPSHLRNNNRTAAELRHLGDHIQIGERERWGKGKRVYGPCCTSTKLVSPRLYDQPRLPVWFICGQCLPRHHCQLCVEDTIGRSSAWLEMSQSPIAQLQASKKEVYTTGFLVPSLVFVFNFIALIAFPSKVVYKERPSGGLLQNNEQAFINKLWSFIDRCQICVITCPCS